ncbi:hypothetical protein ACQ4PT_013947 [Festuca glaucescens]
MGVSSKHSPSHPVAMDKDLVPHPIMRAALEGNLRVLREMATVVKNDGGIWNRALMLAAMEGRLDVCRLLVEDVRVDVNKPVSDDEGNTAVFVSAMLGTAATTRYLLDCGADPTVAGSMGTALHGAVINGQYETIELLLSRGIDVDLFDSVHGTALHVAASKGEAGMVKLLLEHSADPNKVFNLDSTPLGMAIQNKSLECVRLLLKAGANPNFLYYNGVTYTMVAANNGLPDIMKCLLDAGANPNTPDSDYGKACKAFEDGLKLDRTNVDIKNALREAQEALKSADCVENNDLFGVN